MSLKFRLIVTIIFFIAQISPRAEAVEGFIRIDSGQNVFYVSEGAKDQTPVIFIHGFPFNHHLWDSQTIRILPNFRVVSFDLRGFGKTQTTIVPFTFEAYVDDFLGVLDSLKIQKAVVVGFSMGGYVALRAIERNPERFAGLVLVDTQGFPDSNEAKFKRWTNIKNIEKDGPSAFAKQFLSVALTRDSQSDKAIVDSLSAMILDNPTTGIEAALVAMASRSDTSSVFSKIRVPTLVLGGDSDKIVPVDVAKQMVTSIPNAILRIIPHAGHISFIDNPAAFNVALDSFLEKVSTHSFQRKLLRKNWRKKS